MGGMSLSFFFKPKEFYFSCSLSVNCTKSYFCYLNIAQSYSERQMFITSKAKMKTHNLKHLDVPFKESLKEKETFFQAFSQVSHFLLKGKDFKIKVK